jgi:hypothetical protein
MVRPRTACGAIAVDTFAYRIFTCAAGGFVPDDEEFHDRFAKISSENKKAEALLRM